MNSPLETLRKALAAYDELYAPMLRSGAAQVLSEPDWVIEARAVLDERASGYTVSTSLVKALEDLQITIKPTDSDDAMSYAATRNSVLNEAIAVARQDRFNPEMLASQQYASQSTSCDFDLQRKKIQSRVEAAIKYNLDQCEYYKGKPNASSLAFDAVKVMDTEGEGQLISRDAALSAISKCLRSGADADSDLQNSAIRNALNRVRFLIPYLPPAIESQPREMRYLIENDGKVCWLYPDGSHRGITAADVRLINSFLRSPVPVSVDLEAGARAISEAQAPDGDGNRAGWRYCVIDAKACADAWGLSWK